MARSRFVGSVRRNRQIALAGPGERRQLGGPAEAGPNTMEPGLWPTWESWL
ncbi:hypothetical protein ACIQU5_36075 [Streptomyces sp. NPDC090306]|uniref:hypothetical protein n=1 Tax=Streptomyces sp. NPDC090306 TaxID=3365961 RepID=UPI0038179334